MIGIIDFGAGNLYSAYHAFKSFHPDITIVKSPSEITEAIVGIVLPGDGSFPFAYNNLKRAGFVDYFKHDLEVPLLGICVGFQLLFDVSDEDGGSPGLGLISGRIKRFSSQAKQKIPHIGWNTGKHLKASKLLNNIPNNSYYYFVHSFFPMLNNRNDQLMESHYIQPFCSAVEQNNVFGFQFHPEKSHIIGWKLIENFVSICKEYK